MPVVGKVTVKTRNSYWENKKTVRKLNGNKGTRENTGQSKSVCGKRRIKYEVSVL